MNHSEKFDLVQRYYNTWYNGERMWGMERVCTAVGKSWITAAEFEEITGETYTAPAGA